MKKIKLFLNIWLPVILWCGLIFYLSSVPNLKAARNPQWDEIIRSGVHLVFYGILYALFFRALNFKKKKKNFRSPLIFACLYALSDEVHQYFIPTRTFQLKDLVVDWSGAGLGWLSIWKGLDWLPKWKKEKVTKIMGFLLIIGGITIISFIYGPVLREEIKYQTLIAKAPVEKEIIPVSEEFGLVIPKIGINAQVFPEVNANDSREYAPLLTKGVAHAQGSALPGQEGNVFIFAHSSDTPLNITRYNAIFYLIDKLENDDQIFLYYQNKRYLYRVSDKKILSPGKVAEYLNQLEGETVTLQTCTPPGTRINRLLIIGQIIND
jgi:LPXTG-site transpeptidase (sortase) family protein